MDVIVVRPDREVDEIEAIMREHRIRHVPVAGDHGLLGVLSIGVRNAFRADDDHQKVEYLTEYSHRRSPMDRGDPPRASPRRLWRLPSRGPKAMDRGGPPGPTPGSENVCPGRSRDARRVREPRRRRCTTRTDRKAASRGPSGGRSRPSGAARG